MLHVYILNFIYSTSCHASYDSEYMEEILRPGKWEDFVNVLCRMERCIVEVESRGLQKWWNRNVCSGNKDMA